MPTVLLLGAANSIHLQRWANALAQAGLDVHLASLHPPLPGAWHPAVHRHALPGSSDAVGLRAYAAAAGALRPLYRSLGAGLLHVHYASGYGLLGMLSGCRPRLVSAWGSDVVEFPQRSLLHRALLRQVLRRADALAATSASLAAQVQAVAGARDGMPVPVTLTPFGVDTSLFCPAVDGPELPPGSDGGLCVGSVRGLEPVYGIDLLIRAFAQVQRGGSGPNRPALPAWPAWRLRLVGDGPQRAALQALARAEGVGDLTDFVGAVPHAQVPGQLRRLSVFVAPSRAEGFGVAALEASACAVPVLASRVGGLPEVVAQDVSGLLVPPEDVDALAAALQRLMQDAPLRRRLGQGGRAWVLAHHDWDDSVLRMLALYRRWLQVPA